MPNIQLSICIATLNRGKFIGQTLDSIICQSPGEVEIVVLDGASTDDTGDVVRQRQVRFSRLRYIRQDTNLGVDHDFAEAVRFAEGDYCWLFSDDDILLPGAIQRVLAAIRGRYAVIIANAEVRTADLSKVLEPRRLSLNTDRIYSSNQSCEFFGTVAKYLTFIGGVIIKRQFWGAREKEKYYGSFFIHVGVLFQSPLSEQALVIAKPLISIRYGNASWLEKYFEIWMFKWPALIWSLDQYPEYIKIQASRKEPWRKIKTLMLLRAKGSYNVNTYSKWLEPRLELSWARAASKAVAYCPGSVLNLLAVIYYSILSQQLVLVDLRNSPFYFLGQPKVLPATSKGNPGAPEIRDQPFLPKARSVSPLDKKEVRSV